MQYGVERSKLSRRANFVSEVLAGRALASDVDDWITEWHDATDGYASEVEIHEFLGMSWPEYQVFVEHPESLRFVIAAHKANEPLEEVLASRSTSGAAARSEGSEAESVLNWLIKRGRVSKKLRKF